MRVSRRLGDCVLFATAFGLPASAFANPVPRPEPISAQVVSVRQGEEVVFVDEQDPIPVIVQQDLKAGDVIKTHSEGAVAIVFSDQMQIRLARNSTLLVKQVSRGAPSDLELTQGSLWARAPRGQSQLTLRTPSATAAIRGTEWGLRIEGSESRIEVASGAVEFFNDHGRLLVESGQAATAQVGQAPVRVIVVDRGAREQMLYYLSRDFIPSTLAPGDPLYAAFEAATLGEFDEAYLRLSSPAASGDPLSFVLATKIGFLTGNEQHISDSLAEGLRLFPDRSDLVAMNAEYLAAYKGRPDLALNEARRAVNLDPENTESLRVLSQIYLERRRLLLAQNTIVRAIELAPQSAELHLHQANIYLRQNRPRKARSALTQAFTLAPDLFATDLGTAHIFALFGENDAALQHALAASASNPGYAPSLLSLAEIYGRLNEPALAEQQLDAADRIDPNNPYTPLYRTALALHHYEGSAGISGAQEALNRFQARGGLYENLSENRESGSNISRAFRFMEMEAWGRYYGDRVFDRFSATSYFDQTLNETPGSFFIRGEDTQFNPQNGDDLDQISSYLQGVILDPLSVAQSNRSLQIDKDEFQEVTLGGTAIVASTSDLFRVRASLQGRVYTGDDDGGIPIAYSLRGQAGRAEQNTLDLSAGSGPDPIDETLDNGFIEAYVGAELSPQDHIVAFATVRKDELTVREDPGFLLLPNNVSTRDEDSFIGFGFWDHQFADQNHLTVGGGYGETRFAGGLLANNAPRLDTSSQTNSFLLFAHYSRAFGDFDIKLGSEGYWNETTSTVSQSQSNEIRLYADGRYKLSEALLLQGQIGLLHRDDQNLAPNDMSRTDLEYHLGGAYEPLRGHWLRAAATQETQITTPFTLAPIQTVGLKGNLVPSRRGEALRSQVFRWDAEWTDRLFTSLEYQDQDTGALQYYAPDGRQVTSVNNGELQRWSASVNYILGHNLALSADYAQTDSSGVEGFLVGQRLPFVPKHTAKTSVVWTSPNRVSMEVSGNYIGEQRSSIFDFTMSPGIAIDDYFTANILARWEPMSKRFEISAGLINAFNNKHQVTANVPAPGRAVFLSIETRF